MRLSRTIRKLRELSRLICVVFPHKWHYEGRRLRVCERCPASQFNSKGWSNINKGKVLDAIRN